MNITKYSKAIGAFIAAVFAVALASEAQAGPGPQRIYMPIKTMKEAQSLKVGTSISYSCGNCGAVVTTVVTPERSYTKGFTCPGCKRAFRVVSPGGGGKGTDLYVLADSYGKFAHISTGGKL
ncbi:MAG: hypothetical protein WCF18_02445 [Chthoniobacteraceae bacterium]